ncbi:replication endonuclease [Chromohalobacter canadensis]|uniref:replication endonuclease n=1 Tax=Chromohalobacter canadensis TaxID=141389 RepID=UPI0021C0535A|nr:replication endonuclease [Chromohalobacter canadensis]MCT8466988.1 replication endonuclease [Chromohalobacter canadensis]
MTAMEQSLAFGTHECRQWREAILASLPSLRDDLAAGFVHVAKRYGNTAGNRWLRRQTRDLIEPSRVYRRFERIAGDLERGFRGMRGRGKTTIEGIQAGCAWLQGVEKRLGIGAFNCSHDDDALVRHAEAQARAVDDERSRLIGNIAQHNRRLRMGLLPPARSAATPQGESVSAQARSMARAIAEARNPLTPPPLGIPLMAVFTWRRAPVMSIAVADELTLRRARARAHQHGIAPPDPKSKTAYQVARLTCSKWWRRKLRRLAGERLEQVQREAHRVHAQAGIYCSNMTIERRRQQKVRNRALLETIEAINQHGQAYTLAELAELGLSNPDHRRAELMLRINDTESESRRLGHIGMFYTMTAPSRFHPVVANKYWDAKRKKYRHRCRRNARYDGATPREAQQHIQQVWARARAQFAREEIGVYGLRVVEPHHDGTPHWHLELFMAPDAEPRVTEILRSHAEDEAPEELFDGRGQKTTARFDAKKIDYSRGTAAGYIAKYISKNINGEQFNRAGVENDGEDRYGVDLNSAAPRIEAWAAVWGIRQFQFVGLPSVTVWREVRRLTERQEQQLADWEAATRPAPTAAERFHAIRQAANAGQWDIFLRLMGGPNTPRKDRPVRPWTVQRMDTDRDEFSHATGEVTSDIQARGRYGDPVSATWGLVACDHKGREAEYLTRVYRWEVRPKQRAAGAGSSGPGAAGAPWTCVNNCTGVDITPPQPDEKTLAEQVSRYREWITSPEMVAALEAVEIETELVRNAPLNVGPVAHPEPEPDEFFPDGL